MSERCERLWRWCRRGLYCVGVAVIVLTLVMTALDMHDRLAEGPPVVHPLEANR